MSFKETNFADDVGVPMDNKSVPQETRDYLLQRGHTAKGTKAANFRHVEGERIAELFPASRVGMDGVDKKNPECWYPKRGIVLPYPDDPTFAVARIEYEIKNLGKTDGPPKFLTPSGREVLPYVPPMVSRKDLLNSKKPLYIVESQFKSVVAAINGVPCIGVSGHSGAFEPGTGCSKIRPEIHEYLKSGREVSLLTDADVHGNLEVRRSLLEFMRVVESDFGCKAVYVELPDLGGGKSGIDDYFAAGHKRKDFDKLPRHVRTSKAVTELRCAFFDQTEDGLAQRFEAQHGQDCRRDRNLDTWFSWKMTSGYREGRIEPEARILQTVASLKAETDAAKLPGDKAARGKFAKECGKLGAQNAAITIAGRRESMAIDATRFDVNPDLLGVQNGVVRLSDGKLLTPDRALQVTKTCPFNFDPKTPAPKLWLSFIRRAADGDRELVRHMQEIAGTFLLGRGDRMEVVFTVGPAFSGKTLFNEAFLDGLGSDYSLASKSGVLMKARQRADAEAASPFLVSLRGKRFVSCSELEQGETLSDVTLKDLTGGDTITARAMYKASVTFRNTARITVKCNHLPNVIGTDDSVWSRIELLPFDVVIPLEERDKELRTKLAAEFSGIFNWALVGLRRYAERGYRLDPPRSVAAMKAEFRVKADTLGYWIDECLEFDPRLSEASGSKELQAEVTSSYMDFAKQNNFGGMSAKTFWQRLRERLDFDPIYRGDGGVSFARNFRLRRSGIETGIISNQERTIREQSAEIAVLRARLQERGTPAGATTSPTPSGAKVLSLIRGGKK